MEEDFKIFIKCKTEIGTRGKKSHTERIGREEGKSDRKRDEYT